MPEVVLPTSLQERIAQEQYQPASASDLPEGVTFGDDNGEPGAAQPNVLQPDGEPGTSAVAQPDTLAAPESPAAASPDANAMLQQMQAYAEQVRQENEALKFQQRMAQLQQSEVEFANSIEHLPPMERERLLHQRETQQRDAILQYQQQQLQGYQTQQMTAAEQAQANNELVAKRMIAYHHAAEAGLDPNNPLIFESLVAPEIQNPDMMKAKIQQWMALGVSGRPRIIAGGDRAANAGAKQPKRGSGDLGALINSRSYELAPAE